MRVFFGLEIDPPTALRIADWRDRQLHCDGRPVSPANFHITLAFVGELGDASMEQLCASVDAWAGQGRAPPGTLSLDRVGYWQRAGIYWLGPASWPPGLTSLATKLRHLASAAGARRDRNTFQPHVSLFRRCTGAPPAPPSIPELALEYNHFCLFESRQGRRGVSYHVLEAWQLGFRRG